MDYGPGHRALALTAYFTTEHEFEHERYHRGIIVYRRTNDQGVVERIVVKHAQQNDYDRDDEVVSEEDVLRQLWGAEHVIRLLSIVGDRAHRHRDFDQPISRPLHALSRILPWKLLVDQVEYNETTEFHWFVMEHLSRGDGCQNLGVHEISEPLLWYFFLCRKILYPSHPTLARQGKALTKRPVIRSCIAMAWPPNLSGLNPPPVVREQIPRPMRAPSFLFHGDLHMGNIMFGEYDSRDDTDPSCHQGVPTIDFGLAYEEQSPEAARANNIVHMASLMYQMACLSENYYVYNDDDDRPAFDVTDIQHLGDFETWLDEDFYYSEQYSRSFRRMLARCLAVEPERRPGLRECLSICTRNIAKTPNWRHLRDEVSELFDRVPPDVRDNDSDYVPSDEESDES
ncbi:hypothetical protein O1611_g1086 [Lasiodiplodia mahajangana]|uniref:Uncharacterized protein n=1 Tax=Lasiodiplodia mahajangana TaxID=1108764 RepID=A0ACC2JYP3_9PEZI|nr:hypothetical protein O1611_g1086 [Lasiodiplodia mahajangana]